MSMRTLIPIVLVAALALPAAAHAAAAPALQPLKPCYVSVGAQEREPVSIMASGFTPGSRVDVLVDGQVAIAGAGVDATGAYVTQVDAPHQAKGQRGFAVTVQEQGNPANRATALSRVTALSVAIRPKRARPARRVRFAGRGFTNNAAIYGHYVFAGQVQKTVSLGRPKGPCGTFKARRRQIPLRHPRTGLWTLQVDQQARYSEQPDSAFVRIDIVVERVFGAQPAIAGSPAGSSAG